MKIKILVTCVLGLGLLIVGGFGINAFRLKDYVDALTFSALFIFIAGIISEIWYRSPKVKREELLFKQKIQVIEYIVNSRKGTRDEFCQKFGIEMYNYCLDHGFIHEPFDCASNNMFWEVTRLAKIRKSEIDEN